jgi:hypothetical protein
MGVGSGNSGYGQTVSSAQVSQGDKILASQLSNLFNDTANARTHQINSVDVAVSAPAVGNKIEFDTFEKLDQLMEKVEEEKLLIAPQQATAEVLRTSTRTSPWNGVITHIVRFTWPNTDARRHFFNASGELRSSASLTQGSGAKTENWRALLNGMGTIIMNRSQTVSSEQSGTGSNIGFNNLTTSYQQIYRKFGSGVYSENSYQVEARVPSTTTIDLRISFRDDDTGNPLIDEDVDGTLVSSVGVLRATGTVQIPAPATSNTSTL